jgi:membrane-associated protein
MHYRTFVVFNVTGGVLWGSGVTVLGYFLGQVGFVRSNIEVILVVIVAVSLILVAVELLRARARNGGLRERS